MTSTDEVQAAFPDFVSSMSEVFDFNSVYEAFREIPTDQFTKIAEKLDKGGMAR